MCMMRWRMGNEVKRDWKGKSGTGARAGVRQETSLIGGSRYVVRISRVGPRGAVNPGAGGLKGSRTPTGWHTTLRRTDHGFTFIFSAVASLR